MQQFDLVHGNRFRKSFLLAVILAIMVLVSYWGVLGNGFINYDDPAYVTENRHVKDGLTLDGMGWAFTASYVSNWHPLTWLSLMLDHDLFGMNAAGYHWTNVILHGFAGLVLFFAMGRMTGQLWCSGFVAGLFLVHPLHVESVAWVAERKDVLSGLFWMLGMWAYVRYAERPCLVRYAWVVLFFVLGLLSKPMVVTFPFVLLLLDYWPLGRMAGDFRKTFGCLLYEKMPLFVLSAVGSIITFLVQKDGEAVASLQHLPFADRLGNAAVSCAGYLVKTVWPFNLAVFYPHPGTWPVWEVFLSFLLILLMTVFVLMQFRRRPYLLIGWLWYLGTLVPVIGLVQVGAQAMADRYTYLPLIGIFIMIAWGSGDRHSESYRSRWMLAITAAAFLGLLVINTSLRVEKWKDSKTLFSDALAVTEMNQLAHYQLALAMMDQGEMPDAVRHYRKAIGIKKDFAHAHNGLGHLLMIQGKYEEAVYQFEETLRIRPDFAPAMKNMGDVRLRQGRTDEAIDLYRRAILHEMEDSELFNNYGVALFMKGEKENALRNIREAIRLKPDYGEAHDNLRKILNRWQDG